MPIISFTGTRDGMTLPQCAKFTTLTRALFASEDEAVWHDGDCKGADDEAHKVVAHHSLQRSLAQRPKIRMIGHPGNMPEFYASNAFDESREVKPNLDRNHDMVDEAEILIACPGTMNELMRSGTWATVRYARKRVNAGQNLVILIIFPDGTVTKEPEGA